MDDMQAKVLVTEADDRSRHEAAARAAEPLALVEERRHHEEMLAAEANDQRRHEASVRTVESVALTLVEECRCPKPATRDSMPTVSPLADERRSHEANAGAIASTKLVLAVCPRARPRRRTGRRNIPQAPISFVEVAQRITPRMLPTLGDTASSPDLTAATLTAMSSSSPRPTTYIDAVLSNMGEWAHVTPLVIAPLPH